MPYAALHDNEELDTIRPLVMKLTDSSFQTAAKVGGLVLAISTIGNLYFLLRYREVYRDATRADWTLQQLAPRQQILENVIREFAGHANSDPGVAEIFRRHQPPSPAAPEAKP